MATVMNYSSSSSLLSISFTLFLIFLVQTSHCLDVNEAVDQNQHIHTLDFSSLLPASTCTPSTRTKGAKKSTLDVFHKHGPCSQPGQDKSTAEPSITSDDVLAHDELRVNAIHARLRPKSTTNQVGGKKDNVPAGSGSPLGSMKVNLPAQSGSLLGGGSYFVRIGLGTPTQFVSLMFDTGSSLTWTQCQPCAVSCYQQQDPIFNPSSSTSYSNPCTSNSTCNYAIRYGDNSFTIGFYSRDKLTISANDVIPSFVFGCGQNNRGLYGRMAGLLGLGRDRSSIVSQTAQTYGRYFSYCLPSTSSSSGYLTLGQGTSTTPEFTPFSSSQGTSSFYFIDILAITVGGRQLPIPASTFSSSGTIIDSGTVITRLQPAAYTAMSSAFDEFMLSRYPKAQGDRLLQNCYDFSNVTTISIPTITFTFGGNVNVKLDASGILFAISQSTACLAFAPNSDASDVGIFGNTQQKTMEVVYDVAGGRLGFGAGGC